MQEQNYLGRLFPLELLVFGIIYLYLLGRGNDFQCSKRTEDSTCFAIDSIDLMLLLFNFSQH